MPEKYSIICEKRGVFLGTHEKYGFFSNMYDFGLYKAPTFEDFKTAKDYAERVLNEENEYEFIFPKFETNDKYVSCIEFIKNGYGNYTGNMIENLPNYVDTMH